MRRAIIEFDPFSESESTVSTEEGILFLGGKFLDITDAAITITENCENCDWCSKLSCGHPRIQAAIPYVDDVNGKSRKVQPLDRPDWCPL